MDKELRVRVPKISIFIYLPKSTPGLEIARMLESRIGGKTEFREFQTVVVGALPYANIAVTSRGRNIKPNLCYDGACIDITAKNYGRVLDAAMLAETIRKITDSQK